MPSTMKHDAIWLGNDESSGAELVLERFDPGRGLLAAVFRKRGLYFTRVFRRAELSDPYSELYWEGGAPSWFDRYEEAEAEALRLLEG